MQLTIIYVFEAFCRIALLRRSLAISHLMLICEALYPGYSISENMISDLGIGSTAGLFNSSIIVLGLLIILSAISFHSFHKNKIFTILMILTGTGAMGVGIFPENY